VIGKYLPVWILKDRLNPQRSLIMEKEETF